jgi:hypothetical protein
VNGFGLDNSVQFLEGDWVFFLFATVLLPDLGPTQSPF